MAGNSAQYRAMFGSQLQAVRSAVARGRNPAAALRAGAGGNPFVATMAGTPLKLAMVCGDVDLVRDLLQKRLAGVNDADAEGTTPLGIAVALQDLPMCKLLLSQSNLNINCVDLSGTTPL